MMKVSDIRKYFMTELAYENYVTDKTGVKTIEMIGAQFVADEPAIFGKVDEDTSSANSTGTDPCLST